MKKITLLLLIVLGIIACSKNKTSEENDIPKDIPTWLQTKIEKFQQQGNKNLYIITEYKIDGVRYFNVSLTYQSCMLCDVYDENGNSVSIKVEKNTIIERVRTIWPVIKE